MSRAFVKEPSESAPPPERMVPDGPNPVTAEGLALIGGHVVRPWRFGVTRAPTER